jgi:hypothetical protein
LANLYFRRFVLAWRDHGHQDQLNAYVVNYADDFVICCRPGNAEEARTRMQTLMTRLGLEVNETKTRIARLPEDDFTFLGYTIARFFGNADSDELAQAFRDYLARHSGMISPTSPI